MAPFDGSRIVAMINWLALIENSGFSTWVRESGSLWSYPGLVFLHTVGLALLVGPSLALDLRLFGVAGELPVAPFERFFPIMWAGFWMNVASGLVLLASEATTKLVNPTFYVKMACIAVAVVVMVKLRGLLREPGLDARPLPPRARTLAWISTLAWLGAITAGRLMAYLGPGSVNAPPQFTRLGG